jgi:hypothetical protein
MSALFTGREPHPTLPLPTAELAAKLGKEWIDRFYATRRQMMLDMESDPLNYGHGRHEVGGIKKCQHN